MIQYNHTKEHRPHKGYRTGQEGKEMTAYFENEAAVDAALKAAKTPDEVRKIAQDLETRMAPHHWTRKAWDCYRTMA